MPACSRGEEASSIAILILEAMRKNGATVAMPEETLVQPVNALHLCEVCTLKEPFDVVLVVS